MGLIFSANRLTDVTAPANDGVNPRTDHQRVPDRDINSPAPVVESSDDDSNAPPDLITTEEEEEIDDGSPTRYTFRVIDATTDQQQINVWFLHVEANRIITHQFPLFHLCDTVGCRLSCCEVIEVERGVFNIVASSSSHSNAVVKPFF